MGVPFHKVASFEIVDIPRIEKMGRAPASHSSSQPEWRRSVKSMRGARGAGASEIALLKCTSAYPSLPEDMNLRTIPHLAQAFGVTVGLSDHTMDTAVPMAALELGARIIEKHFTLSRSILGPDNVRVGSVSAHFSSGGFSA
jgi:N-acetylneuraminate synthase